jgi:hypothetical protein
MPKTRAQQNRAIRQEALREQLASQGHVQHVVEIAEKLSEPDIEALDIQRLKAKADIHFKLIDKYLPSLKAMELTGDPENPVVVDNKWVLNPVKALPPGYGDAGNIPDQDD